MREHSLGEGEERALAKLAGQLGERGWMCGTAESCTGGLVGAAITAVPGSSAWYRGGVISYANEVKMGLLGVGEAVLAGHGAVSEPVALAMAKGACRALGVHMAVAITGVAGPGGGTPEKPVGTVWIAWAFGEETGGASRACCFHFSGNREEVRLAARKAALEGLATFAEQGGV